MFRSIISAFAKSGPREGIPLGRSTVVVPPALHQLCPQPSLQNPIFNETGAFFFSTTARSNVAQQYQYQQKTQQRDKQQQHRQQRDKQQQQHRQQRRPLRSRQDATASTSASLSLRPLPQQQTPQPSTKSMRFKKSLTDMFIENNNNTMSMSELFLQSHNLLSTTTTTTDPNVVAMQPPPPPQQQQQQHWRQYNPSHPQQQQQQRRRRSNRSRYATNTTTTTTTTTRYPSNDDDNNRQQNGINSSSSSSNNNTNVTTSSTTTTYDTAFGAHAVRGGANKINYSNNDHNHDNLRFRGSRRRGTTTTTKTITTATTRRYITKAAASEASITTLDTKNNNDNINSDNNASSKPSSSSSSSSSSSEETTAAGEVRHHHHHRLRQYLVVSPTEFDNVLYHLLRINSQSKVVVFAQTATLAKVYGKRLANAGIKNIWIGAGDDKHEQLKDSYAAFQFARAGVFVCTVHAFASVCPSNSNNDNDNDNDVGLVIVAGAFVNSNVYYQIGDTNAAAADATHGRIITLLRDFEKNAIDHAAKEQSSSGEGGGGAFGGGIHENFGEQIDYSDIVRMSPRSIASLGPWLNRKKSLAFDALCDLLGYLVTNQSPTTWQFSNMRDVLAGLRAIAQSYGMSHLPISGDQARKLGIVEEDFRFLTSHIRPSSYSTTSSGDAEQASIADDGTTSTNNKEQQRQSSYAQILGFR